MPSVKPGESRNDFMKRCVPMRHSEHPTEDNKQSVAVCFSMWKEHMKKSNASLDASKTTDEDKKDHKKKKKDPYAEMMMSPEEMNKKIDGMTELECISLMKKMGKYKEGMTIGEMKSMLKSMSKNTELHNKMMGK